MSKIMTLPKIGVNMTEAIIDQWFVKPGDVVAKGDAIFLAETDKATQDIFATDSGIVGKLLAQEGDKIEIHEPIMVLLDEGEALSEDSQDERLAEEAPDQKQEAAIAKPIISVPEKIDAERIRISPLAKKLAKERGINIEDLTPKQAGKRIVKADVLAFMPTMKKTAATKQVVLAIDEADILESIPMSRTRKVIAGRMSESNLNKPCAALTLCANADEIVRLRDTFKEHDIKVSYNDILTKIVSQALCKHRNINAVLNGEVIQLLKHVNIGVAVDSDKGLMVPVIKDADKKSIRQIAQDFADMVLAIKDNTIGADDLSGGTFTITNLGMFEIEQFTPIINPPECCILAVGAMKKEFVPDEDLQPKLATTMKLTLVFDHRIVDGAPAAKFLQSVKHYVEFPEFLL